MNVTAEILRNHELYGGSDSTNPAYSSSNKSLNYAVRSNSMLNAQVERVTAIPSVFNYQDSVGLFGAENIFIKVQLDIDKQKLFGPEIDRSLTYLEATSDPEDPTADIYYSAADMNFNIDTTTVNDYEPALVSAEVNASVFKPVVSIDLKNLKTGNKYIDSWFDVRLYTKYREEFAYDRMFIKPNDYFYIGFHARNTKRLPYNVSMTVGEEYLSEYLLPPEDRKYFVS